VPERDGAEWFRLPIDRAFVVQGHGTVVTGVGRVRVGGGGDELEWHKGDGTSEPVRVRGLNNHGRPAERFAAGSGRRSTSPGCRTSRSAAGRSWPPGYLAAPPC
jgi:selenocysteine-specific elongation factor